jgi:hypothetical protein
MNSLPQTPRTARGEKSVRIIDADDSFEAVDTVRHAASVIRSLRSTSSSMR